MPPRKKAKVKNKVEDVEIVEEVETLDVISSDSEKSQDDNTQSADLSDKPRDDKEESKTEEKIEEPKQLSESESLRQSLKEEYLQKSEKINQVNSKLSKSEEEEPETPVKEKPQKTGFFRDRELSFKTFFISQMIILILSLAFLGGMYYILYGHDSRMGAADYNPVSREPTSFDLEINSPDDNTLVFDSSIVISGKTSPDSAVLISNEDDFSAVQADNEGNFAKVINLTTGANPITITAYDNQGDIKQIQRSIYYSDTSLEEEKDVEK